DVDANGRRALLFADGRGLLAYHLRETGLMFETTPRLLVQAAGLLAIPDEEALPFYDIARDYVGDGNTEILLPLVDGTAVFTRAEEGWVKSGQLSLRPRANY